MNRIQMVSTGAYLPGEPLTNADLERLAGPLPADILAGIQVQRRYWMVDPATGEHRETNSEMAYKAAKQALDRAAIDPEEVDLLLVSTGSPEYPLPPMATLLQD
jgi:3-oxoacyl-[acyl-carrier-protein] synthase-3